MTESKQEYENQEETEKMNWNKKKKKISMTS